MLRTYKLGEADRIVVLLTRGHGKVRAVAKGVRKTKSRFGGRLEPHQPRRRCCSTRAASSTSSPRPRRSTTSGPSARTSTGSTPGRRHARGRRPGGPGAASRSPRSTRCCVGALRTLAAQPSPLVVPAFFWKLLAARGLPARARRAACAAARRTPLVAFDLDEGGVLCRTCRRGVADQPGGARRCCAASSAASSVGVLAEPRVAGHATRSSMLATRRHRAPPRAPPPRRAPARHGTDAPRARGSSGPREQAAR